MQGRALRMFSILLNLISKNFIFVMMLQILRETKAGLND
ncbi:MAG: hypothetical protein FD166_1728 [Bacteroidetes bacterium]|nr:MAG: hypothetical protein FD166_1728 [Bacteroidota bacterium]